MEPVAEVKRSRESYTEEKVAAMEDAWQNGMRSLKDKDKISGLASKLNLPAEKIEVWIGNRRAKDKRGGMAPQYSKKKVAVRGPSSYTLFSQQFKRESSSKQEHFKNVARKWSGLTEEERQTWKDNASAIRKSAKKGMTDEEATCFHFKQIENSIQVLGSLGFEALVIALKEDHNPNLLGTAKGIDYVNQSEILESFRKSVFGNTVYLPAPVKKEKGDLRAQVRQVLNYCWKTATGESRSVPYSMLLASPPKTPWKLEGLPVPLKEPSNYGVGELKKIIERKADIKFTEKTLTSQNTAEDIMGSIASNEFELDIVHDLSNEDEPDSTPIPIGATEPADLQGPIIQSGATEPADLQGPIIQSEMVDHMTELLELNAEEAPIISLNVDPQSEDKIIKKLLKRQKPLKNDSEGKYKKVSRPKKKKYSQVKDELVDNMSHPLELNKAPADSLNVKTGSSKWTYVEVDDLTAPKAFQPAVSNTRKRKQKIYADM